jgi:hypothetical protein
VAPARDQMLKFPHDQHDDFVDALAYIGLGLTMQLPAYDADRDRPTEFGEKTFGFMKAQRDQAERSVKLHFSSGGF